MEQKLCKNCKHYSASSANALDDRCLKYTSIPAYALVRGDGLTRDHYAFCYMMRETDMRCGESAQWFESMAGTKKHGISVRTGFTYFDSPPVLPRRPEKAETLDAAIDAALEKKS